MLFKNSGSLLCDRERLDLKTKWNQAAFFLKHARHTRGEEKREPWDWRETWEGRRAGRGGAGARLPIKGKRLPDEPRQ